MRSVRARIHGPVIATATALLVVSGCGARESSIEGSGVVPLASPVGTRADIIERDQMTLKARSMEELLTSRLSSIVIRRARGNTWIELRGPSSLHASTEALIIVDGIQNSTRGLLAMNPEHVQRIQLLKGAAASAYGVRGGNGVVVVTTRRYGQ
jgi:TonB-dependent SusC/RagA subfamily outer membrane receptor